ncbi:MAG: hypothetical protein M1338_05070 [Patescibacteria group bacterium]|nr:hypothetical protein [Patescibacteria group bacterium]
MDTRQKTTWSIFAVVIVILAAIFGYAWYKGLIFSSADVIGYGYGYGSCPPVPTSTVTVTVTASPETDLPKFDNAQIVSQYVPNSMKVGNTYQAMVTVRNIGNTTWTKSALYRLGSANPYDNLNWTIGRVALEDWDNIKPAQMKTFTFNVTPKNAGSQNFQWRMLKEGVAWFGDLTPNLTINVSESVSCNQPKPTFFGISPNPIDIGKTFYVGCDFGAIMNSIVPSGNPSPCSFVYFDGTKALFKCTAADKPGSYAIKCNTIAGTSSNTCATSKPAGTVVVKKPWYMFWKK